MRESVPIARYSPVCNVLRQWKTSLILTYRVYRLYDIYNYTHFVILLIHVYPYSTCTVLARFLQQHLYVFGHIFVVVLVLVSVIFVQYSKCFSKNI